MYLTKKFREEYFFCYFILNSIHTYIASQVFTSFPFRIVTRKNVSRHPLQIIPDINPQVMEIIDGQLERAAKMDFIFAVTVVFAHLLPAFPNASSGFSPYIFLPPSGSAWLSTGMILSSGKP